MKKAKISNKYKKLMIAYLVVAILLTIWAIVAVVYSSTTRGDKIGDILSQVLVLCFLFIPELILVTIFLIMNIVSLVLINKLNTKNKALTLFYLIYYLAMVVATIVVFAITKNLFISSIIQFVGVIVPTALCCVNIQKARKSI